MDFTRYEHLEDQGKRALTVQAALELLKAEASAGIAVRHKTIKNLNKVDQYADWFEEALRVKAE